MPGPLDREALERHQRLLAELLEGQAELQELRQALGHDVVERGPGAVAVAELAELPEDLEPLLGRPDRLAHGDPAAATHAEHDEAAAAVAEQEVLVAEQGEVGEHRRVRGRLDDRAGARDVVRAAR